MKHADCCCLYNIYLLCRASENEILRSGERYGHTKQLLIFCRAPNEKRPARPPLLSVAALAIRDT